MATAGESAVRDATTELRPIDLDELNAHAELQTRTDRKYFVPAGIFRQLTAELRDQFDVLDIDGRRLFGYESVYFDSPQLGSYRAHLQRRRKRYKVRTRAYLDSGACLLEVKLEGHRGTTVKQRLPYPFEQRASLTPDARQFLADLLENTYDIEPPERLDAVLATGYRRATLTSRTESARLTCDVGLGCSSGEREVAMLGDYVLVESKSEGSRGSGADRLLRALGVRPTRVSKYCVGVAVLHPELPSNPWHPTLRRYFGWCPAGAA